MGEAAVAAVVTFLLQSIVSTESSFMIRWKGLDALLWIIKLILNSQHLVQSKARGGLKRDRNKRAFLVGDSYITLVACRDRLSRNSVAQVGLDKESNI